MRFIKGMDLCRSFCLEVVEPLIHERYPMLPHALGLLGYGSDVLGYDDEVSTDHMWGPRFYLFLRPEDMDVQDELHTVFCENFPHEFMGVAVHFSEPDASDGGMRVMLPIGEGHGTPLYWAHSPQSFLVDYLGKLPEDAFDWLALSEHRLLGLSSGQLFVDKLSFKTTLDGFRQYPEDVRRYLIASQWTLISEERAFVKRTATIGDDTGSRLVCSRIVERLMRLCFLYNNRYAPYSKWFGTAFSQLRVPDDLQTALRSALSTGSIHEREQAMVQAQVMVADIHNASCLTEVIPIRVQPYFNRDILVIDTDALSEATRKTIGDPLLREMPLVGSFSQIGNFVHLSDSPDLVDSIADLYRRVARQRAGNSLPAP